MRRLAAIWRGKEEQSQKDGVEVTMSVLTKLLDTYLIFGSLHMNSSLNQAWDVEVNVCDMV